MNTFDALTIPIDGTSLIEASAGTGKTYGIALLFTRLILLENISIEKIAVLTFTVAATAELKTRLRSRLNEVKHYMQDGQYPNSENIDNQDLQRLFVYAQDKKISAQELYLRVHRALIDFDKAGIYTIHAFCRSILNEEAFACGVPFNLEMQDEYERKQLEQTFCEDFWRKHIAQNKELATICFNKNITPDNILKQIKSFIAQPLLEKNKISIDNCVYQIRKSQEQLFRLPEIKVDDNILLDIQKNFDKDTELWQTLKQRLQEIGSNELELQFWQIYSQLNGNKYRKNTFVSIFDHLQYMLKGLPYDITEIIQKSDAMLPENLVFKSKAQQPKNLDNFRLFAQYGIACQNLLHNLGFMVLNYLDNAIKEHKEKHSSKRSFNDLLLDIYSALKNKELPKKLSKKYDVLMVDEFQDTDKIQYAIFKQSFIDKKKSVFLVGDPKQAIYRFRGADIYAYLNAKQDATHLYSMNTNYRTHQKLVNVCNALFNTNNAFLNINIPFYPVEADRKEWHISGSLKEQILPNALTVLNIDGENSEEKSADIQRQIAADMCANHIAQILNANFTYQKDGRTEVLSAGKIAILVRSHAHGELMRKILKNKGIDSVTLLQQSIFTTLEAQSLCALMEFLLNPLNNQELWHFVQSSVLINQSLGEIQAESRDDVRTNAIIEIAHKTHHLWENKGFFVAFRYFDAQLNIETNLIARQALRTLTNLNQLLELLAEEEKNYFGTHALLRFLQQQIAQPAHGDNGKLRLESDENLVKIITLHASKGLQYPIVYCPFLFIKGQKDLSISEFEIIHDEHYSGSLKNKNTLDKATMEHITQNLKAENMRLLYVALTRAEEALILCCGQNTNLDAPINYLLKEGLSQSSVPKMQKDLWQEWLQEYADLSVEIKDYIENTWFRQPEKQHIHFQAATLNDDERHRIKQHRQFSSFSAWLRQVKTSHAFNSEEDNIIDYSERQSTINETHAAQGIHTFPAGASAGLCLHEILEKFNFYQPAKSQEAHIQRMLTAYQFDLAHTDDIIALCDQVRFTPLNHGISLSHITSPNRLPESQFLLNELNFQPEIVLHYLGDTLSENIRQALHQVTQHTVQGFFNGFIDMLARDKDGRVYIIDYKSNKLGTDTNDYHAAALDIAMAEHQYAVQALIYAIATRRMLCLYDACPKILSVRYLFLRGLNSENTNGIWSWDINSNTLAQLENALSASPQAFQAT